MKLTILSFLIFAAQSVFSQCNPSVNDSSSATVCAGQRVFFEARSPGYTTTINWDFGVAAVSSNVQKPTYAYSDPGLYTVTFTGTGPSGTCTKTLSVTVRPSPQINFKLLSPAVQCFKGNKFCFIDSSEAPFGKIIKQTYLISNGQKIIDNDPVFPIHICITINDPSGGYFDVIVESYDSNGCVTKKQYTDVVKVISKVLVHAEIAADLSRFTCDTIHAVIENKSQISLSVINKFTWNWGDGTIETGRKDSNTIWWDGVNGDGLIKKIYPNTGSNLVTLSVELDSGCVDSTVFTVATRHEVVGDVYLDENKNCMRDSNEYLMEGNILGNIQFNDGYGHIKNGQYSLSVMNGVDYSIDLIPFESNKNYSAFCPSPLKIKLDKNASCTVEGTPLGMQVSDSCIGVKLDISSGRFRRCVSGFDKIGLINYSFKTAYNIRLHVRLPMFMTVNDIHLPDDIVFTTQNLGNNKYLFRTDSLTSFQNEVILINRSIKCDEASRNGRGCVKASITTDSQCNTSDIEIISSKLSDSTTSIKVKNVGASSLVKGLSLYADNTLLFRTNVSSMGNDSVTISFKHKLGIFYGILAWNNEDFIKYRSIIYNDNNQLVEGVKSGFNWISESFYEQRRCQTVVDSYDPNDIQVSPIAIDIKTELPIEKRLTYTIRFQNTGNDTAYRVVVEDTLNDYFNLKTFEPISSTHDYYYTIEKNNGSTKLSFIFEDINLVDSATNEVASQGSITFKIALKKETSNVNVVKNKAAIFFDFNPPIITNYADVTLVDREKNFEPIEIWKDDTLIQKISYIDTTICGYFISPITGKRYVSGTILELDPNSNDLKHYYSFDLTTPFVWVNASQNGARLDAQNSYPQNYTWLDCDDGYKVIENETNKIFEASQNGNYALMIKNSICTDTSDCFEVNTLGVKDLLDSNKPIVYPNPNRGVFFISAELSLITEMRLYAMNGKQIPIIKHEGYFAVSDKAQSGVYFLKFVVDGNVYTERIVVIR